MMPASELSLIDRWQRGFPLIDRPFAVVGRAAALREDETIRAFHRLHAAGVISRIGAVVRPNTIGASTLAALAVPQERLEEVAALISREPLVTHNYERSHALNLWFVIAGADAEAIAATRRRIAKRTGLAVLDLPLAKAYHLDLGFPLHGPRPARGAAGMAAEDYRPDGRDRAILAAIEDGLPLVERPYEAVAAALGLDQDEVIARLARLSEVGIVTRFGCVVRHRALGYTANAMAVWDVPDDEVDAVAAIFARNPCVTLCYRRPRRLPLWPYNLFCMIHAKLRREVHAAIDVLNLQADTGLRGQAVLFSLRCFRQRGAVFSDRAEVN